MGNINDLMSFADNKLKNNSISDIINELKLNDDLTIELYGEKYEKIKY